MKEVIDNKEITKLPPQNLEMEQSLLGALLCDKKEDWLSKLDSSDFYKDSHKIIFEAIKATENGDILSVSHYLEKHGSLQDIGGRTYLAHLSGTYLTSWSVKNYIKIIKELSERRKLIIASRILEQQAFDENSNPEKIKKDFMETVEQISTEDIDRHRVTPISELLSKEVVEYPYLAKGLVPAMAITSITADSGQGKSLLVLKMAYHISKGTPLFDHFETQKSKTLIVDQEMDENTLVMRAKENIGEDIDIDFIYQSYIQIDNPEDYNWLKRKIKDNGYELLILDTLTTIHSKEENSSTEMREVNNLLLKLIAETGVTIIYLHHHRKTTKGEKMGQATSRGSTEIIAKVSSHLLIESSRFRTDEGFGGFEMTISQEKSRQQAPTPRFAVKMIFDHTTGFNFWEYCGEINEGKKKIDDAKDFVLATLSELPEATINDLSQNIKDKGLKIGTNNLRDACKILEAEEAIISRKGPGGAYIYSLSVS